MKQLDSFKLMALVCWLVKSKIYEGVNVLDITVLISQNKNNKMPQTPQRNQCLVVLRACPAVNLTKFNQPKHSS